MDILLLIAGLALILLGANYLTDGSAAVAQRFKVPEFIIGLTIVAVGTSTPELVVSLMSAINGSGAMAIGNVVGSNIFNCFIILGICAIIKPLLFSRGTIRRDIPIGVVTSLLLLLLTSDKLLGLGSEDNISRWEGIAMLLLYIVLMVWTIRKAKSEMISEQDNEQTTKSYPMWLSVVMIIGGLCGLVFGGNIFLDSATNIARLLGVSESVIALTLVAGGTSIPELASSVIALMKGKSDLALGNVVGSNIANILLILGLCGTVNPLTLGDITIVDMLVVLLSSILLFVSAFTFKRKALDRTEGVIFILIYVAYMWYLLK